MIQPWSGKTQSSAINSAIEVDITGCVLLWLYRYLPFSGVGGQMDSVICQKGKPIIALPSTTARTFRGLYPCWNPVRALWPRAPMHLHRYQYGIAYLYGQNKLRRRAKALIEITRVTARRWSDAALTVSIRMSLNAPFIKRPAWALSPLLISISFDDALIFLGVFLWSMKSRASMIDTYTPSVADVVRTTMLSADEKENGR